MPRRTNLLPPPTTEIFIPTLPPTETATELPSATPLPTDTATALPTLTETPLPTATETETPLPVPTASETATATALPTASETATATALPTGTEMGTAEASVTATASETATGTAEATLTSSPTATLTPTLMPSVTQLALPIEPISQSIQALQAVTGRDIAYLNGVNFAADSIQVLDANGNNLFSASGGFPQWSITGTQLAYLSPAPQVNRHNFATGSTEALGNSTTLILPRINGTFWDPVWSPSTSNNKMAFVWSRLTDRVDIYVMDANGTNLRNLTSGISDPINFLPTWSPDGQWIAFTSTDNTALVYKINIVRADGSGSVINVPTSSSHSLPFWAGDNSQLAFWVVTNPTNPTFAMVSFNSTAGSIGAVTTFDSGVSADWGRVWMPGGGQYAYMSAFDVTAKTFQLIYSGDNSLIGTGWFPKWRPTYTPWSVAVSPAALIPPIVRESDTQCPLTINNSIKAQGIACALRTYAEYGALTWADLIALILHAEGDVLLTSSSNCTDNTFPGIPAPLNPQPTPPAPTPSPTLIPVSVNFVPNSPCNPVQQEFVYAVVEQMFNKCDEPADVPDNIGQCSEEGLLGYLGQVQRYRENNVSDSTTYASLASQEINYFLNATQGRVFGRCPCTTGNVAIEAEAQQGQVRNKNDARYQAYAQTLYPDFWYSYSYFDNQSGASAANRYLKIY